jgi:hypothetical protein
MFVARRLMMAQSFVSCCLEGEEDVEGVPGESDDGEGSEEVGSDEAKEGGGVKRG